MNSRTHIPDRAAPPDEGILARIVRRIAGASARRPKATMALWLLFVVGLVAAGAQTGTKMLEGADANVGGSRSADRALERAGLSDPSVESIVVRSRSAAKTAGATRSLEARLRRLPEVRSVRGPERAPEQSKAGGRTVLVQATIRGDPTDASDKVGTIEDAVAKVRAGHAGTQLVQSGSASYEKGTDDLVSEDLQKAETLSLPITLVILVVAFGALAAASVPLMLGITSVAAAMGALGLISQVAPMGDAASSLVVLIGLAVGVDYSLFYIRREREERCNGRGRQAAVDAAAAAVGRAIVVSGLTVIVALAGLLITGVPVFLSMALATISVVAIAVLGSLTVLPAVLAKLGDRIDRGRVPLLARWRDRRAERAGGRPHGAWAAVARVVTRRPAAALVTTVAVLATIAVPAVHMHTADQDQNAVPKDEPVAKADAAVQRAFPGSPDSAELVVTGRGLGGGAERDRLRAFGERGRSATGGRGDVAVRVARDGRTALVDVPMRDESADDDARIVDALRQNVAPTVTAVQPGAKAQVTGDAAESTDFTDRLRSGTPMVVGVVLALAFVLLLAAFRSVRLAASVIGLNLLSVLASYGVLTAVFQNDWAEKLLDFTSNGSITNYLPLFMFVILFGLSMDYTVLVLERIREARRAGLSAREAAAEGVGATAGVVTSAAVVMVAVFSIFAMLRLVEMKQLGVGLAMAVLIDATLVRAIALPATVALLGDRGLKPARRPRARRRAGWDDPVPVGNGR